jgi:hypothetical protein
MTKMTLALAALLAGATLANAAHADGMRVGFGFPLGSFVAHSNESYSGRDFNRVERPRAARRDYQESAPVRQAKIKRPVQEEIAETPAKAAATPAVKTAKLEDKVVTSDSATTTVIEKTPVAKADAAPAQTVATKASTETKSTVTTETTASNDVAPAHTVDPTPAATQTPHVCRRYSPAIAALVDVPCE